MKAQMAKVDKQKVYGWDEAIKLVKETSGVKFDAAVEIHARLGIDLVKLKPSLLLLALKKKKKLKKPERILFTAKRISKKSRIRARLNLKSPLPPRI
jgi:ribosomal protein L1